MSEDGEDYGDRRNAGDDDDDFDYDTKKNAKSGKPGPGGNAKGIKRDNDVYDEEFPADSGSEIPSEDNAGEELDGHQEQEEEPQIQQKPRGKPTKIEQPKYANDDEDEDNQESDRLVGGYNPSDYANLNVETEVKELFKYITRFKPTNMDIDSSLKPFIPDYIPAVGEVDAFLKPNRPDTNLENLGLTSVDEPCLNQSKKRDMIFIYEKNRRKGDKVKEVHSIENAEAKPKEIADWINMVSKFPRQPPVVSYTKKFPDFDNLMQVWPPEIEEALHQLKMPNEDLDVPLADLCKMACAVVDIPVHNTTNDRNLIESLHVFFTLYSEFRANQYFQNQNEQYVYGSAQL